MSADASTWKQRPPPRGREMPAQVQRHGIRARRVRAVATHRDTPRRRPRTAHGPAAGVPWRLTGSSRLGSVCANALTFAPRCLSVCDFRHEFRSGDGPSRRPRHGSGSPIRAAGPCSNDGPVRRLPKRIRSVRFFARRFAWDGARLAGPTAFASVARGGLFRPGANTSSDEGVSHPVPPWAAHGSSAGHRRVTVLDPGGVGGRLMQVSPTSSASACPAALLPASDPLPAAWNPLCLACVLHAMSVPPANPAAPRRTARSHRRKAHR